MSSVNHKRKRITIDSFNLNLASRTVKYTPHLLKDLVHDFSIPQINYILTQGEWDIKFKESKKRSSPNRLTKPKTKDGWCNLIHDLFNQRKITWWPDPNSLITWVLDENAVPMNLDSFSFDKANESKTPSQTVDLTQDSDSSDDDDDDSSDDDAGDDDDIIIVPPPKKKQRIETEKATDDVDDLIDVVAHERTTCPFSFKRFDEMNPDEITKFYCGCKVSMEGFIMQENRINLYLSGPTCNPDGLLKRINCPNCNRPSLSESKLRTMKQVIADEDCTLSMDSGEDSEEF